MTDAGPTQDLCFLLVEGLKAPLVPVRPPATLAVGERVYAIGSPEGLELREAGILVKPSSTLF